VAGLLTHSLVALMQLSKLTTLEVYELGAVAEAVVDVAAQLTGLQKLKLTNVWALTQPAVLQLTALTALHELALCNEGFTGLHLVNKVTEHLQHAQWAEIEHRMPCACQSVADSFGTWLRPSTWQSGSLAVWQTLLEAVPLYIVTLHQITLCTAQMLRKSLTALNIVVFCLCRHAVSTLLMYGFSFYATYCAMKTAAKHYSSAALELQRHLASSCLHRW
jgi:hypothetical protein